MVDWLSLSELACVPGRPARLVACGARAPLTHADWCRDVAVWHAALSGLTASRVALYVDDPVPFAAALFGAWRAGKHVYLPGDDRPATLAALREAGCLLVGDLSDAFAPAVRRVDPVDDAPPLDTEVARLTVYTSGSQGAPQEIDKTLKQLDDEVRLLQDTFGRRLGDAPDALSHATVSHQHIYGLLFQVLWPLAAGRPLFARRLVYPEEIVEALSRGPSLLISSPAHLKRLGHHLDWPGVRSNLVAVFSSGGPLPYEAAQEALNLTGQLPLEVFGSSETGGIAWRQSRTEREPWTPFEDVRWRVDDDGTLMIDSDRMHPAGWWTTSDLAVAAPDGGFCLHGRKDRIVKVEEKRVSLGAVEAALLALPEVEEARAVCVETPLGQRVAAVLVLSPLGREGLSSGGRGVLSRTLRERLGATLDTMAQPRRWRFVDALPVNPQGKATEAMLRALFDAEQAPAGHGLPACTWLVREADSARVSLDITAALPVFDGHFPVAPILPGVAQLDWAVQLAQLHFGMADAPLRLEAVKFVRPVVPGTALLLQLDRHKGRASQFTLSVHYRLYSVSPTGAEIEHASGRLVWPADAGTEETCA